MAEEDDNRLSQLRWLALLAAVAGAVYLCWLIALPFLDVLAWAAVLAIIFFPVHRWIEARLGRSGWSALVSTLLVIVVILLPLTLMTIAVARQLAGITQNLQANVDSLLDPNSPVTGRALRWLSRYVDIEQWRSQQYITERLRQFSGTLAQRSLGLVGGVAGVVIQIFFVIFTLYYLFRDGRQIRNGLYGVLPLTRTQSQEVMTRTTEVISASLYGVLVISAIQGTLGGLAFWALGLPSPLVWGLVMMLASMIPMVGSFIVWVPASIYLAFSGHWMKALLLVAWGTLVIGLIDNFLRPKLVGGRAHLHELLIFFSVLGGLQVFGVLGLVLGPVVVAITLALLDVVRQAGRPPEVTKREMPLMESQSPSTSLAAAAE